MYRAVVPSVLAAYNINYRTINSAQKGYRNESYPVVLTDKRTINVLFYKREPGIPTRMKRADRVSQYLADAHFPVRIRHDPRTLQLARAGQKTYVAIYNYLPGHTIPWEAYTKKHIKLLGWAMSDMHARLRDMPAGQLSQHTVIIELLSLLTRMQEYFDDPSVIGALSNKLQLTVETDYIDKLRQLVLLFEDSTNDQPLHMDMVRGNVLFHAPQGDDYWQIGDVALSGVIDFEKASFGHPLFDIARTLAFLLVDCAVKDDLKIRRYFLASGYDKRGQASYNPHTVFNGVPYVKLLDGLTSVFLLHDLYKFLRHTPYESLPSNHHYIRTRNILISYAMVRYS